MGHSDNVCNICACAIFVLVQYLCLHIAQGFKFVNL